MVSSGIVTFDVSDHLGTYITIALDEHLGTVQNSGGGVGLEFPQINTENTAKFKQLLENETWEAVNSTNDTQAKYDKFIEIYNNHYEAAFPKSPPRRKNQRVNPKPFILPWLEDACNRKNNFYYDDQNPRRSTVSATS